MILIDEILKQLRSIEYLAEKESAPGKRRRNSFPGISRTRACCLQIDSVRLLFMKFSEREG